MNDNRPFLPLPLPSADDHRRFEEWVKKQKEKEEKMEEDTRVIVIEI